MKAKDIISLFEKDFSNVAITHPFYCQKDQIETIFSLQFKRDFDIHKIITFIEKPDYVKFFIKTNFSSITIESVPLTVENGGRYLTSQIHDMEIKSIELSLETKNPSAVFGFDRKAVDATNNSVINQFVELVYSYDEEFFVPEHSLYYSKEEIDGRNERYFELIQKVIGY